MQISAAVSVVNVRLMIVQSYIVHHYDADLPQKYYLPPQEVPPGHVSLANCGRASLLLQRLGRVGAGSTEGLPQDGREGKGYGRDACKQDRP